MLHDVELNVIIVDNDPNERRQYPHYYAVLIKCLAYVRYCIGPFS